MNMFACCSPQTIVLIEATKQENGKALKPIAEEEEENLFAKKAGC